MFHEKGFKSLSGEKQAELIEKSTGTIEKIKWYLYYIG